MVDLLVNITSLTGIDPTLQTHFDIHPEPKKKLDSITKLDNYLSVCSQLDESDWTYFLSILIPLLGDANYKVETAIVSCLYKLVEVVGDPIVPHIDQIIPDLYGKLADSRDVVRQKVFDLLLFLFHYVDPEEMMNKLTPGLAHNNFKVRQQVLFKNI